MNKVEQETKKMLLQERINLLNELLEKNLEYNRNKPFGRNLYIEREIVKYFTEYINKYEKEKLLLSN